MSDGKEFQVGTTLGKQDPKWAWVLVGGHAVEQEVMQMCQVWGRMRQ